MEDKKFENQIYEEIPHFMFAIEVGRSLSYLIRDSYKLRFISQVNNIRSRLIKEWGIKLPPFLIRENIYLNSKSYRFILFNREIVKQEVEPGKSLLIMKKDKAEKLPVPTRTDPIYSLPCIWLDEEEKYRYSATNVYSVSIEELMLEHMESILRANASRLITSESVREKLDLFKMIEPSMVRKSLQKIDFSGFVKVMKNLVPEGVPLTQISRVIRSLAQTENSDKDPDSMTEVLRKDLKNNIFNYAFRDKKLMFVTLDSHLQLWLFKKANREKKLPENDVILNKLLEELTHTYLSLQKKGFRMGILCGESVRLILRRALEKTLPDVVIIKPGEIEPNQGIKFFKKIRLKSTRLWLNWLWFWVSSDIKSRRKILTDFIKLRNYIHLCKISKKRLEMFFNKEKSISFTPPTDISRLAGKFNTKLPAVQPLSKLQKLAALLVKSDSKAIKKVFNDLNYKQLVNLVIEIANLPENIEKSSIFNMDSMVGKTYREEQIKILTSQIKNALPDIKVKFELSSIQKLAIFLASFTPKTAEKMYRQILSDIRGRELEELMKSSNNKQPISVSEMRNWVLEDFMWYYKGSRFPRVPFTDKQWMLILRQIAMKSPEEMAQSISQLWLVKDSFMDSFNKFSFEMPAYSSYWIRKYISSNLESDLIIRQIEKALLLIQLLPQELAEPIIENMGPRWEKILKNIPASPYISNPQAIGKILSQFLSYYYTEYYRVEDIRPVQN
ncbi:MAG: FHIPEP family type III secretion protein [Vulcanimicrobiota bacterium]